jgi:Xaa-Pro aminopeptidase
LVGCLEDEGLDGLIVTHLPNVRYLAGFSGSAGIVAVLRWETVLLTDFRYRTQAELEVGRTVRVETVPTNVWSRLWEILGGLPGKMQLGFEAHAVTVQQSKDFAGVGLGITLAPVTGLVERLRVAKDPAEVAAIREAARLAGEALDATLIQVRAGQRELDVAATLERELRIRGSEWHPFPTIVASGHRSALPHARTERREIEAGDLLLLDFGAQLDGYCADITRTVVVGRRADERQRALYDLVYMAQLSARQSVKAGMTGCEADSLARSLIEERGFAAEFGHSLGHGLGLEVHEDPRVSKSNEAPLPAGAVVTIEPGIYISGWGGVRIEDDIYLGADGTEMLSDGRTELRELT